MPSIQEALNKALDINGAIAVALVDFQSGMSLGTAGNGDFNIELAAAGNTEVVRAKKNVRDKLGLTDLIEDILVTLDNQYHLIRMLRSNKNVFLYIALDRSKSNLAMARMKLSKIEESIIL